MAHTILSSHGQSKEWRLEQSWYTNGKQNECELFQKECVYQITGFDISSKTNFRLRLDTFELRQVKDPLAEEDGFEYTEDMDGFVSIHNLTMHLIAFKCLGAIYPAAPISANLCVFFIINCLNIYML